MNLENKTVEELKQMCKKKKIPDYSKLLKKDLIKVLSKKMKGGEFDENKINGIYSKNFRISNPEKKYSVASRKNFAESPVYFIALREDNPEIFKSLEQNSQKKNNSLNTKQNPQKKNHLFICTIPDETKPDETKPDETKPDGIKIKLTGEIYAIHKDFLIIKKKRTVTNFFRNLFKK